MQQPAADKAESVLIIDDNEELLDVVGRGLRALGYRVRTAKSGEEGLRAAREEHFDHAILDIAMYPLDGIYCLLTLKRISPQTRCIMMTGAPRVPEERTCLALGASAYLRKPFQLSVLVQHLRQPSDEQSRS
ncbi:MAG: response regulator transcription factor [Armatimonadota bacterium]